MDLQSVTDLISRLGLPAIFLLTMIEGDITLLLAGVLAHGQAFGDYSFAQVLVVGTVAGVASDNAAYFLGRGARSGVKKYRFYCVARPRIERLTEKFGLLSIFVSKYTYGLRWGACAFYGVAHMPYLRFLLLSFASCFMWVLTLSGLGFIFHSAIYNLIGDFEKFPVILLALVIAGVVGFYLAERFWLSKKVEEADPEKIQALEHAAEVKLNEIKEEISDIIPKPLSRHKEAPEKTKETESSIVNRES
ncbi:MAG TPA: VTT domain-containing protein [Pyrinomonadaceae bacterium]|jgi:membrane protein DedA with SNARE-associated domain|nr:VTT domain-containing protein [Pyrinomonadaceae bacterium]